MQRPWRGRQSGTGVAARAAAFIGACVAARRGGAAIDRQTLVAGSARLFVPPCRRAGARACGGARAAACAHRLGAIHREGERLCLLGRLLGNGRHFGDANLRAAASARGGGGARTRATTREPRTPTAQGGDQRGPIPRCVPPATPCRRLDARRCAFSGYAYTLNRKSMTSPSATTYSLPSDRSTPASRAAASVPAATMSS